MDMFYNIAYLILIAFLNSIDNLGVALAYSISCTKIPLSKNIVLATMAFAVSYISALSGGFISTFLPETTCNILSMLLLVIMGSNMIYQSFKEKKDNTDGCKILTNKEALTIGFILAADDIGGSVSSGLIGYNAFMVSMPFFVLSIIFFALANYGTKLTAKLNIGKKATIISGSIMILLGILRLFD